MVPLLTKLACRTFAVLLLVAGVGIGIHTGITQSGSAPTDAPSEVAEEDLGDSQGEQQDRYDWHASYAKNAANQDASSKADSVADVAADQAKALDKDYKDAKEEAKEKKDDEEEDGPVDIGPIPDDCNEYSGNRAAGCARLLEKGFGLDQMPCLDKLWNKESGWNEKASNPSGAYGIPQALPGDKMASEGSDWETNPNTQIKWGLGYISGRYNDPCSAWEHSEANGWY